MTFPEICIDCNAKLTKQEQTYYHFRCEKCEKNITSRLAESYIDKKVTCERAEEPCKTCNEPTKRVIGHWDGVNGTHGNIYNCDSKTCPRKIEQDKKAVESKEEIELIRQKHNERNIDMQALDAARIEARITMRDLANFANIPASLYCDYRGCRKEIPQEVYDVLLERINLNEHVAFKMVEGWEYFKKNPEKAKIYAEIEKQQMTLRAILNNDTEYKRLVTLCDSTRNTYPKKHESSVLEDLIYLVRQGVDSKLIVYTDSIYVLKNHYLRVIVKRIKQ